MTELNPRFSGIARLYGSAGLAALSRSHVLVAGLGGVGSWAAEALVRSGVGAITLVDLDEICVTNINRQLPALGSTLGKAKVSVLAARLQDINPHCHVNPVFDFITQSNVREHVKAPINGVLDAIDSVTPKAALIVACKYQKIPLVVCGGAGAQVDPTKIDVTDLNRSWNDPLLAKTRQVLRRQYGYSRNPKRYYSVPCVFSTEQLRFLQEDGRMAQNKPDNLTGADCNSGFGASTMVTGSFGFVAAARLIERLIQRAEKNS